MTYERKWLTKTHPVDVYIAEDGKEFDNRWDCLDYETGNKFKTSFDNMRKRIQPLVLEFGEQTNDYDDIE